jgi:heme-degrading monooxygenase HmoA
VSPAHVLVWELRVRPGCEAAFEEAYGPRGAWAQLFARAPGYLGTELLRDAADALRYVTIDRWESADAFVRFRAAFADEYRALDLSCDALTTVEAPLGAYGVVEP